MGSWGRKQSRLQLPLPLPLPLPPPLPPPGPPKAAWQLHGPRRRSRQRRLYSSRRRHVAAEPRACQATPLHALALGPGPSKPAVLPLLWRAARRALRVRLGRLEGRALWWTWAGEAASSLGTAAGGAGCRALRPPQGSAKLGTANFFADLVRHAGRPAAAAGAGSPLGKCWPSSRLGWSHCCPRLLWATSHSRPASRACGMTAATALHGRPQAAWLQHCCGLCLHASAACGQMHAATALPCAAAGLSGRAPSSGCSEAAR